MAINRRQLFRLSAGTALVPAALSLTGFDPAKDILVTPAAAAPGQRQLAWPGEWERGLLQMHQMSPPGPEAVMPRLGGVALNDLELWSNNGLLRWVAMPSSEIWLPDEEGAGVGLMVMRRGRTLDVLLRRIAAPTGSPGRSLA